jgi:hypothetical protein
MQQLLELFAIQRQSDRRRYRAYRRIPRLVHHQRHLAEAVSVFQSGEQTLVPNNLKPSSHDDVKQATGIALTKNVLSRLKRRLQTKMRCRLQ